MFRMLGVTKLLAWQSACAT
uniref:Uncharacterized protein n=1 Tax=Anguilla anguilla TaxID=7936 RepID=A0A0E9RZV1_ANGAN